MARYLSRADLSRIAGKYIDQYYTRFGISKNAPEPIDPERLASAVLGLNVKMLPLCSDGSVLGLTVFQRCGFTVTLGDGTKLVEIFMPRDVVIDSALAADRCTGCRNFTIAHEAAHHILADLFPNDYGKAVKCRGHIAYRERNGQPSWEEWQANTLAAELLMPTFLVNAEIERAALCMPNGILYKSASDPNYEKILEMAARMGVSWSAIRIRLQQMQVIKGKPIHCHPLDIIRFGELFSKVRSGDVRVLLGSTAKMGAGTNVQSRLVAVHHLDVGWKPSDMTQRNGRIIRQGNMNKEVKVFNYVTEGTFDAYLWQTLENKQRFISQIMTSKSPVRSCEDVDEQALSYAEIKALCAGNPLIKEKMDLDVQVAKLKVLKADHQSQKFRLQDKLLTKFLADIRETNAYIAGVKADAQLAAAHPQVQEGFCGMTIKGVTYDEKKTAGERLVLACSELPNAEEKVIGNYRGFELSLRFDTYRSEYQALLKGQRKYTVPLGTDPLGNIIRLDNSLNNFPERITSAENELATLHQQQAAAQIEVEKPFPQEEELAEKSARLAELNAQLDVDEKSHEPEQDEEEQEDAPRRPSVLAALEEKSDKPEPVKPFKSYLDKDGDAR